MTQFWVTCAVVAAAFLLAFEGSSAATSSCLPRDVVLVVDSSGEKSDFDDVKTLARNIVTSFDVGRSSSDDYFALFRFDATIKQKTNFGGIKSASNLKNKINSLSSNGKAASNLALAFNEATTLLQNKGRDNTEKVIIIITDGIVNVPSPTRATVYKICDNISKKSQATQENLEICTENIVSESVSTDGITVLYVPISGRSGTEDDILSSTGDLATYVDQVTTSNEALQASCYVPVTTPEPTASPTSAPTSQPTMAPIETDCFTEDAKYTSVKKVSGPSSYDTSDAAECGALCQQTDTCEYFTYLGRKSNCYLYKSVGNLKTGTASRNLYVSGPKYCTASPTSQPTDTRIATSAPTGAPTESPTDAPTQSPTDSPTAAPTDAPTDAPTQSPTESPTAAPTDAPTQAPTDSPTAAPTDAPTQAPTDSPTAAPTDAPTQSPTDSPTAAPTQSPTDSPTAAPTDAPTQSPTDSPTAAPTDAPTQSPTTAPTVLITGSPTSAPTGLGEISSSMIDEGLAVGEEYSLEFDFMLEGTYNAQPQSVIQRGGTQSASSSSNYVRQPAVFVGRNARNLLLRTSVQGRSNPGCDSDISLTLDQVYHIVINVANGVSADLYVDGTLGCSISLTSSQLLYVDEEWPVYVGGPENMYPAATGQIGNIKWANQTISI